MVEAHKNKLLDFLQSMETFKAKMGTVAPEMVLQFLKEKLKAAKELENIVMAEMMQVKKLLDSIREKIVSNITTADRMGGCLQDTADHYLESFDQQV